jgi:hypothetical protein
MSWFDTIRHWILCAISESFIAGDPIGKGHIDQYFAASSAYGSIALHGSQEDGFGGITSVDGRSFAAGCEHAAPQRAGVRSNGSNSRPVAEASDFGNPFAKIQSAQ